MHAHIHLHAMHTERKRMRESFSSGRSPWEVSPVCEVQSDCKILLFHFTDTNPKADWPAKKFQQHSPTTMGSNLIAVILLGVGMPPGEAGSPPLSLSTPQSHLSPGRWYQKGGRAPLPVCSLRRSRFVATFLSHPRFLCTVGGCCTLNFTVFCLLHPRPRGFWATSVSSNMSQWFP